MKIGSCKFKIRRVGGFTLPEILLSVALMAIIAGIGIPLFRDVQIRNDLSLAVDGFVQGARRAQMLSMSPQDDSVWGVKAQASSIIVFKGSAFTSRDTAFDEIYAISPTILVSGTTEFVFTKVFGLLTTTGAVTFTSSDGDVASPVINAKGMVTY